MDNIDLSNNDENLIEENNNDLKPESNYYNKVKTKYQGWKDKVIDKTSADTEEEKLYGSDWEQLGYQRTIAGFLYTFGLLIPQIFIGIAFIPLLKYTELRFVEVGGIAAVANGVFGVVYVILDLDLNAAVNRFIPQYYISDPKKATEYVSFFIKYQMWSGLFQITFVAIYIFYYLIPNGSPFAYVSWYMIFISVKQYPATLGTFQSLIGSMQHLNKSNLITFYRASIVEPITKIGGGLVGLYLGYKNPAWGPMMGLALGTAVGSYLDDFFTFALGTYWLSKILDPYGIQIRDIYADPVPKDVWKSALWYSARTMPRTLFGAIMGFAGFLITVSAVPGYITWAPLIVMAGSIAKFVAWSDDIINGSQPVFSEAYNNNKLELTKYYIAQGLKYNFWMLMILGTFNVVAFPAIIDIIIPLFMAEEWRPITYMVPIIVLLFLYKPFNDIADKMINISGHPEINTYLGIIGTVFNLWMTYQMLIVWQMSWLGMILVLVPWDLIQLVIRWIYMQKKILRMDKKFWKDIAWQVFVAPIISGGIFASVVAFLMYAVWPLVRAPFIGKNLFGLVGGAILIPALALLLLLLLGAMILYFPLYGYFGGFDDMSLKTFRKSVGLTGPSLWMIYPMYKIFKKNHDKSPEWIKNKSYMKIGDVAQEELKELAIMRNQNLIKKE